MNQDLVAVRRAVDRCRLPAGEAGMQGGAQLLCRDPKLARFVMIHTDGGLQGCVLQVSPDANERRILTHPRGKAGRPVLQFGDRLGLHCELVRTASGLAAHAGVLCGRDNAFHAGYPAQIPAQISQNRRQRGSLSLRFQLHKKPSLVEARDDRRSQFGDHVSHMRESARSTSSTLPCNSTIAVKETSVACSRRDHDLPNVLLREKTLRESCGTSSRMRRC